MMTNKKFYEEIDSFRELHCEGCLDNVDLEKIRNLLPKELKCFGEYQESCYPCCLSVECKIHKKLA